MQIILNLKTQTLKTVDSLYSLFNFRALKDVSVTTVVQFGVHSSRCFQRLLAKMSMMFSLQLFINKTFGSTEPGRIYHGIKELKIPMEVSLKSI